MDELKLLIAHNLDVLEFLDILDISFPELIDILEEQRRGRHRCRVG